MFTTWTKRKKIVAALSLPVVAFVIFFAVIVIDGECYDTWRHVHHLRYMRDAWIRDGSPEPPEVSRYIGASRSSTTFVYTASHVIDGQSYPGLFAHRSIPPFRGTFVITRTGEVILLDARGQTRRVWIHKTKAAAW